MTNIFYVQNMLLEYPIEGGKIPRKKTLACMLKGTARI
jgi:hypothetical protein